MLDENAGTWSNPYTDFALTAPQGKVLEKILTSQDLTREEKLVKMRLLDRVRAYNFKADNPSEGFKRIQAFGQLAEILNEMEGK